MIQTKSYSKTITPFLRTNMYMLKPNIAGFRILKPFPMRHGFSYGKGIENMSYKWEPGFTDEFTKQEAIKRVKKRIEHHLSLLSMADITHSIYVQTASGNTKIIDLSTQTFAINANTDRGIFIAGGAIFTTLTNIPLIMTSGDCHTLIIYAMNKFGIPITGLVHAGRRELDAELPRHAIEHLVHYYNCNPMNIYIGIVHGIGSENHILQPDDIDRELKNRTIWEPYITRPIPSGPFHLDNLQLLLHQITPAFIPGKNIEAYNNDNFELALGGKSFSHRARQGRILISTQLI